MSKKAKSTAPKSNETVLNSLFDSFADKENNDIIGREGIESILSKIKLDPEDVKVLVLFFKLGASTIPGSITRAEFVQGNMS